MKKTVLFVHGFGVMKDARGMFTEISKAFSLLGIDSVLVDLNVQDIEGNIVVNSFSKQTDILKNAYSRIEEGEVYLICHSQGCVIAALANLTDVKKYIFLAPPTESDYTKTIEYFSKNPLTVIDVQGISKLARRDGTFTVVPHEYWIDREHLDIKDLYQHFTSKNSVCVVKALQDEVVSNVGIDEVFVGAEMVDLDGGHDFKGDVRESLVSLCVELTR